MDEKSWVKKLWLDLKRAIYIFGVITVIMCLKMLLWVFAAIKAIEVHKYHIFILDNRNYFGGKKSILKIFCVTNNKLVAKQYFRVVAYMLHQIMIIRIQHCFGIRACIVEIDLKVKYIMTNAGKNILKRELVKGVRPWVKYSMKLA